MTLAAFGAFFIGAYTEAGMVMVLFALGEALEGFTAEKARRSIETLLDFVPESATRLVSENNSLREVDTPLRDLRAGDHILVRPGEIIPMDGTIESGISAVNQASITGESRLINKQAGDGVFASAINGEGALTIRVTQIAAENTISKVVRLVKEAQTRQAPAERFIDRFARWYTPLVVVLAALVAIIPPVFFGEPFLNPASGEHGWLYRGLTLLVISCPCALVISTPVSIISAISNAARHGVLFKGGLALEQLSNARVIAFDKTGTLTEGTPVVVAARGRDHREFTALGSDCSDCSDLVALAHAVERRSQHPLAQAVADAARKLGVEERYAAAE
jgi:Cd2+/Zn2+-exporting ATPase